MNRITTFALLLTLSFASATSSSDVIRAADRVAVATNGLIVSCPAPFGGFGSAGRQCVLLEMSPGTARSALSALLPNLYGGWRAASSTDLVYNWMSQSSGYVEIMLSRRPDGMAGTLVYLNTLAPTASSTPLFQRTLRLAASRLHGADVVALQNRLMDLSGVDRGEGGDGWFGPVTEANVIAFQSTNGLSPNGIVDKTTWNRLFSSSARAFSAELAKAIAARSRK